MTTATSFEFLNYPSTRDDKVKNVYTWLQGKKNDDGVESKYWRIHDTIYDFEDWIKLHPGGEDWLLVTRGTDITEAFEAHHPSIEITKKLLTKYEVKKTTKPRNAPYTFNEGDFYSVLRDRINPILKKVGKGPSQKMKLISDSLFFSFFFLSFLSIYFQSYIISMISGILLGMLCISAHNYFHQGKNWRMFYFDCGMISSYEWRISHALSHHLYSNTVQDVEVSALEPIFQFLPKENKTFMARFGVILYSNIIYWIILPLQYLIKWIGIFKGKVKLRNENFIVLIHLMLLLCFSYFINNSLISSYFCWLFMHLSCSYWFVFIGLIAAHHHPDIWHHGDDLKYNSNDWGIRQMEAVKDRKDVTGNLFLVATMYGDHTLHHLFPTVDHSKLHYLYPVFLETCKDFNIDFQFETISSLAIGKYRQLARITPKKSK